MTFAEALIVYLSLGAPFGTFALFRLERNKNLRTLSVVTAAFLLWPVYAAKLSFVRKRKSAGRPVFGDPHSSDSTAVDSARDSARVLRKHLIANHRRKFTDLIDHLESYIELSVFFMTETGTEKGRMSSFLEVAGRGNERIGTKCIQRRNLAKVRRHHKLAYAMVARELAKFPEEASLVTRHLEKIAHDLNDARMLESVDGIRSKHLLEEQGGAEELKWREPKRESRTALT
jgi:hypothetical protein